MGSKVMGWKCVLQNFTLPRLGLWPAQVINWEELIYEGKQDIGHVMQLLMCCDALKLCQMCSCTSE